MEQYFVVRYSRDNGLEIMSPLLPKSEAEECLFKESVAWISAECGITEKRAAEIFQQACEGDGTLDGDAIDGIDGELDGFYLYAYPDSMELIDYADISAYIQLCAPLSREEERLWENLVS